MQQNKMETEYSRKEIINWRIKFMNELRFSIFYFLMLNFVCKKRRDKKRKHTNKNNTNENEKDLFFFFFVIFQT